MADFTMLCPHCKQELNVSEDWLGMEVDCPVCKNPFPVFKQAPAKTRSFLSEKIHPIVDKAKSHIQSRTQLKNGKTTDANATKKFSKAGRIILLIIKAGLLLSSCFCFALAWYHFENGGLPQEAYGLYPAANRTGKDSSKIYEGYGGVSVGNSAYGAYQNTLAIADNTNYIVENTANISTNATASAMILRESFRLNKLLTGYLGAAIFFLLLGAFIDRIFILPDKGK